MDSNLPIQVPGQPYTPDVALAMHAGQVNRAIKQLRDRKNLKNNNNERYRSNQLELVYAKANGTSAECYVRPGSLQVVAYGSRTVEFVPFTWQGNTHYSNTVITITNGNSLYGSYDVDPVGVVTNVALEVKASDWANQPHWRPNDPEGNGTAGNASVELFKITLAGNSVVSEKVHDGNPVHYIDAWVGTNLGSGAEPYKQKLVGNEYQFRSTVGNYAVTESETATEIVLDFVGNNVGTGEQVYLQPGDAGKDHPAEADFKSFAAGTGLTVTTIGGDTIQYSATGGTYSNNSNVHVEAKSYYTTTVSGQAGVMIDNESVVTTTYYWRDGLYAGTTDPGLTGNCDDVYVDRWVPD